MKTTNLNAIRKCRPCEPGWKKLLKYLGKEKADDEPLPFSLILESNGLDDALWCMRAAPQYTLNWQRYALWCARQAHHLMHDQRSIIALDVAEKFLNGTATREELEVAYTAAADAADAAAYTAAADTAYTAAAAADAAAYTAYAAAADAADAAAAYTAYAVRAAYTAYAAAAADAADAAAADAAAADAADAAAYTAAVHATAQKAEFLRVVS